MEQAPPHHTRYNAHNYGSGLNDISYEYNHNEQQCLDSVKEGVATNQMTAAKKRNEGASLLSSTMKEISTMTSFARMKRRGSNESFHRMPRRGSNDSPKVSTTVRVLPRRNSMGAMSSSRLNETSLGNTMKEISTMHSFNRMKRRGSNESSHGMPRRGSNESPIMSTVRMPRRNSIGNTTPSRMQRRGSNESPGVDQSMRRCRTRRRHSMKSFTEMNGLLMGSTDRSTAIIRRTTGSTRAGSNSTDSHDQSRGTGETPAIRRISRRYSNESSHRINRRGSLTDSMFAPISSNSEHFQDFVNGARPQSGGVKTQEICFIPRTAVTPEEERRDRLLVSASWLASHVPTCVLYRLLEETKTDPVLRTQSRKLSNSNGSSSSDESDSTVSDLSDLSDFEKFQPGEISESSTSVEPSVRFSLPSSFEPTSTTIDTSSSSSRSVSKMTSRLASKTSSTSSHRYPCQGARIDGDVPVTMLTQPDHVEQHVLDETARSRQEHRDVTDLIRIRCAKVVSRKLMTEFDGNYAYHLRRPHMTTVPEDDMKFDLALKALGVGTRWHQGGNGVERKQTVAFVDPFPHDSDDERQKASRYSAGKRKSAVFKEPLLSESDLSSSRQSGSGTWQQVGGSLQWKGAGSGLPYASRIECAILFIDISGFTRLSTLLDTESFSKAINSYFELIINQVTAHGGDVLKFAGDAVYVEWSYLRPNPVPLDGTESFTPSSLSECVLAAALCAAKVVSECSDFQISIETAGRRLEHSDASESATLNVHCGLGVGEITAVHVGNHYLRREYVVLGDPLDQVAEAAQCAQLGEVVCSPRALKFLSSVCEFREAIVPFDQPRVIVTREMKHWGQITVKLQNKSFASEDTPRKMARKLTSKSLERYHELISLYAHPVLVGNDRTVIDGQHWHSTCSAQERHEQEAELRSVYVMFIAPLISVNVSGNNDLDGSLFEMLNDIMNLTTRELEKFNGHLRQFIVDDKGVVLIATFGLKGTNHVHMVAEFALPATVAIHNALQVELGVQNQVGATFGNAYCGVVGGLKRHEYAVMGPGVNLAARLMASPKNPGILVDNAVRSLADNSYAFNALPSVKAKGFSEPVPIFEPLSPVERTWGRVMPNFVGRKNEMKEMMNVAKILAGKERPTRLIFLTGESGMGKSTTVVHGLECIRRTMKSHKQKLILTKRVCRAGDLLLPFGVFSNILLDVVKYYEGWTEDKSVSSFSGSLYSFGSVDWENCSVCSASVSSHRSNAEVALSRVCREMNAPPEFAELVGHRLLGFDLQAQPRSGPQKDDPVSFKSLVDFMVRVFLRCTQESNLTVVALDDIHNLDELSWEVIRGLFDTGKDILIVCTSRRLSMEGLCVDKEFWNRLTLKHKMDGRFLLMPVEALQEAEVNQLITKTLGIQLKHVSKQLSRNVMAQSLGCPSFACAILETLKRHHGGTSHESASSRSEETVSSSLMGLVVSRIDSLDASVRHVLSIGAVLGASFELVELVAFLKESTEEERFREQIQGSLRALELAVEEGVLYVSHEMNDETGAMNDSWSTSSVPSETHLKLSQRHNSFRFTFCSDVWRDAILSLMLDSRKRDIHGTIAHSLQARLGTDTTDYMSTMKLFSHWKASGNTEAATQLALSITRSYAELGMHNQSIRLLDEAFEMWSITRKPVDGTCSFTSMSEVNLNSLTAVDVEQLIQLLVSAGKTLASAHRLAESVAAYQKGLAIWSHAEAANHVEPRSIVFPIFTGLLLAIKLGQLQQDEECALEQSIVARFEQEARKHDDPVHLARATAMHAEFLGRMGKFEDAIMAHGDLSEVYDAEEHTTGITAAYGSDKVAQSFGQCASWYMQIEDPESAIEVYEYVESELLPLMVRTDVHNAMMIIYPLLWVLKDNGHPTEAKQLFGEYVLRTDTQSLPVHESISIILDLAKGNVPDDRIRSYVEWALVEENLHFGSALNIQLGHAGHCPDGISAEICFLLATEPCCDPSEAEKLLTFAMTIARDVLSFTEERKMIVARSQIYSVYRTVKHMTEKNDFVSPQTHFAFDDAQHKVKPRVLLKENLRLAESFRSFSSEDLPSFHDDSINVDSSHGLLQDSSCALVDDSSSAWVDDSSLSLSRV